MLSKILAGGLSAGVFLLWWPEHVPGEGLQQLVLRGVLWTMSFELLLLAFGPLERMAVAALGARLADRKPRRVLTERLQSAPAPARAGGAVALACLGLAAPAWLLAGSPHTLIDRAEAKPRVVKQVIVKRQVVRERVVVRAPAAGAATPAAAAPAVVAERATAAPAPARKASTTTPPKRRAQPTSQAVAKADPETVPATTPKTTAAQPTAVAPPAATATPAEPEPAAAPR